ncbi:glycosyltransferase 87 family protein [Rhizohabitans arisaemae]|uniref:glycosyltransferase 87 family protein n=1 Tax=Rhizohabitans arisaemae TaxID=2720610 RepID=UPI0024B15FE2|nr:glycosyltransferase 87 family protein [Rhizohabitans arisaemae]
MRSTERAFLAVRMWVPALLLVVVALAPLVHYWLTNPGDQRLVDLEVYRAGGEAVLSGRAVYDFITPAPQLLPFTYPPISALLAAPLAWMSWPTAQWVWVAGIYLALAVTVYFAFRPLLDRVGRWAPLMLAAVVVVTAYLMPMRDQTRFGQVDILLVALCLADCAIRERPGGRSRWPRGVLIGLATAIKLTPGVFLIYLWMTGRRRAAIVATSTAAILTIIPFLIIPGDAATFWFDALLDSERLGSNKATTNQSMRGMLLRVYLPDLLTTVLWLTLVAVVAWYGFRAARRVALIGTTPAPGGLLSPGAPPSWGEVTGVALTGLMALLLSPVSWIHHFAWIVVVLGALVGSGRDRVRLLVAGGVWLYYTLTIPWWGVSLRAAEITALSPVAGRIVQNAFGLGAVALVWVLGYWLPKRYSSNHLT